MKPIYRIIRQGSQLLKQKSIHIMCLSFEERCVAYPKILSEINLPKKTHYFFAINLPNINVSAYLQQIRKNNADKIKAFLPSIHIISFSDILQLISEKNEFSNFFIDLSGFPRSYIFKILNQLYSYLEEKHGRKVFCIYTYPKEYAFGNLQKPSFKINYVFKKPQKTKDIKSLIIVPGFDLEYTHVCLEHISNSVRDGLSPQWLIPFPGRSYSFYERVIESHFSLINKTKESQIELYPQEQLAFAFNKILKQIKNLSDPVFIIPLGCRITCVPVFLSASYCKKKKKNINIIHPQTLKYDTLRSDGYITPFIESLPLNIETWIQE